MVFCFVQNFFSDNTRVRIFIFFVAHSAKFFSRIQHLVIWQKLWIRLFFFSSTIIRIFFSATLGIRIFFWKKTIGVHVLLQLIFPGKIQMRNCQLPEYKYVQHNFISINPLTNCIFLFRFYLTRSFDSCFIFANNHCINGWPRFGWFMVFNSTVNNISVKLLYRDGKFYW
jgi:hypothetical protein